MSGAPGGDVAPGPVTCPEDVAGLLGSLAAGGQLAGVVEGLLARLLVTAQDADDEGATADGDAVPTLFTNESGTDVALVAASEQRRTVGAEEASTSGLIGLGASGLGELAAACRRLAAWATWGEALAAACLTGCPELSSHPGQWGPDGRVSEVVGYQERRFNATCLLSTRLGLSRSRAGQIVDHGQALMSMGFAPVEAMERCGVLDSAKASLVTRRLEGVPAPVALAVQERVLPQAPKRSVSQVGRDIERALTETDPTGHAERVRANQERRCVSRPRPAGEGVSQVRLVLPTMDALLLDATLDAIAASARAAGERRTLGQLRADALSAMALSTLRTSQQDAYTQPSPKESEHGGEAQAEANGSGPAAPARLLPDGVPLEGLLGALSSLVGSTSPWWTPSGTGHLPLPENVHVDVQVTVPLNSLTDPGGLAQIEDPTDPALAEHDPGGRDPATSGRTLPTTSGRTLPSSSGVSLPEPGPTTPAFSCSAAHDSSPAASLSTAPIAQPAASTSASLSASPAEVAEVRIGARSVAVPAMTAWALAAGGTWKRLITDPVSGVVIDVGRTRYRPPAGLADLVRARDRACVFPTCQTPASRCDIDHLTAWSQGGTTSLDNLVVLCEAHHRLKHTPGWALTRDQASGTLSWHTPDKTVYQRHPDGTITRLPKRVGPHQHHLPSSVIPGNLSQQISPDILNRLNRALDRTLDNQAHNHTSLNANTSRSRSGRARLETRGPQPGQKPGAFETAPYPQAAHTLQLAPLIDQAPPF